jgi:RNA polymerase sigma factor for flagellar operon FliA
MSHPADLMSPSREDRILQEQGLVHHVAKSIWHMIGRAVPLEDLVGYGQIGLIEAIDRFQPEAHCQFSTYAYYRIRGAILDGLCKLQGLSRRLMEKLRFYRGLHEVLAAHYEACDFSMEDLEQVWRTLDEALHESLVLFMLAHASVLSDEDPGSATEGEASVLAEEWRRQVRQALNQLQDADRRLIEMVYFEGLNLSEAAQRIGISRSWACRLHQRAIQALRRLIQRDMNPPPGERVLR